MNAVTQPSETGSHARLSASLFLVVVDPEAEELPLLGVDHAPILANGAAVDPPAGRAVFAGSHVTPQHQWGYPGYSMPRVIRG